MKQRKAKMSPIEAALSTARKTWRVHVPPADAPLVPDTNVFIDGSHILMIHVEHDIDKIALGNVFDLNILPKEESDPLMTASVVKDANLIGIYSTSHLLDMLRYLHGIGQHEVEIKSHGPGMPLIMRGHDNKRAVEGVLAPRVEETSFKEEDDEW